jgi:hypothetical protein
MLYDRISRYALENYAVIYAVEADANQTVRHMSQHGIEVESLVESGALTIVDRNSLYSVPKTDLECRSVMDSWHSMMLKAKKKGRFEGILAIGNAETLAESGMEQNLVKYEQGIGARFQIPLEAVCCYNAKSIARLSLGGLVSILNAHHSTVHHGDRYREWDPRRAVSLASAGISKALGEDLSSLIFKTMKLCYKVDGSQLAASPETLEKMLVKILGKNAADHTLAYIKDEIRKSISF